MKRETMIAPNWMKDEVVPKILDMDYVKRNVVFRLVNEAAVRDGEVSDPWNGDMVIVYRIHMKNDMSIVVSYSDIKRMFGDVDTMRKLAKENTPRLFPAIFLGMKEQLERICGFSIGEEPEKMYVLTNKTGVNGATCILYPDIHKVIREKINGAYYIIPSSIHELIIVPADMVEKGKEELDNIIGDINTEVVDEKDFLSNKSLYVSPGNVIASTTLMDRIEKTKNKLKERDEIIRKNEEMIDFMNEIIKEIF